MTHTLALSLAQCGKTKNKKKCGKYGMNQKPRIRDNNACNMTSYAFDTSEPLLFESCTTLSWLFCVKRLKYGMPIRRALESNSNFMEPAFFSLRSVVLISCVQKRTS